MSKDNLLLSSIVIPPEEIISAFNLKETTENVIDEKYELTIKLMKDRLEMMPGLIQTLKLFKESNLKIALTSSGTRRYINVILNKFDLGNYFDLIVAGDDVSKGKPDPEIYKELGLSKNEMYEWDVGVQTVYRRDFENGIVLVNPWEANLF